MLFATQFSERLRQAKNEEALPALARELTEIIQESAPTFKPLLLIELGSPTKKGAELDLSLSDMVKRSELKAEFLSIVDSYVDELFEKKVRCDEGLVESQKLLADIQKLSPTTASGMLAKTDSLARAKKGKGSAEFRVRRILGEIDTYARDQVYRDFCVSGLIKSSKARRIIVSTNVVCKETHVYWKSYVHTRLDGILQIENEHLLRKAERLPLTSHKVKNVKTIRVTFSLKEGAFKSSQVALLDEELPEKVESPPTKRIQYIPLEPGEKVAGLKVLSNGDRFLDLVDDPENQFLYDFEDND